MAALEHKRTQVANFGEPSALSVGEVVADRYRIEALLGEGGMGMVYRAEHMHLRKPVAIKVLLPELSAVHEVVARFAREAIAAGKIRSPHVAAATDFGRLADGSFFLVMEYVDGRTLRSVLNDGALEPRRALRILRGVASAIDAAHAVGIVHRDLKPENIMLVHRDGEPDFVKVLDFGIAKMVPVEGGTQAAPATALTKLGSLIGTADYMSPEQALGQPAGTRSDLYSMGVILFEMLGGKRPYAGEGLVVLQQHVMADIPALPPPVAGRAGPQVVAILRRLLVKNPTDRCASTTELLHALDGGAPVPPSAPHRVSPPALERAQATASAAMSVAERWALAVRRQPPPRKWMIAGSAAVVLGILVALLVRATSAETPSSAAPAQSASAARSPDLQDTATASTASTAKTNNSSTPFEELPPPPAPTSRSRRSYPR